MIVGAVMSTVLMATKATRKTEAINAALQNAREIQEHLTSEISTSISKDSLTPGLGFKFELSDGLVPAHFMRPTWCRSGIR